MSAESSPSTAILLIAHGSRRASANADLVRLATLIGERTDFAAIEIGYLELAEPTIPQGAQACVERGAQRVVMLPYFLSAGEHVCGDLERYRQEFSSAHPNTEFRLCSPLGLHPLVVDAVLARLDEGLRDG